MKSLWTLEEFGISLRLNYELDNEANKNHLHLINDYYIFLASSDNN